MMPAPRIKPDPLRANIARRGLHVEPFGQKAYRVYGPGVDMLVVNLALLKPEELRPAFDQAG